jgi:hypothetical protein
MNRAFLVDRRTGEVEPIQIESDDGVRKYFPGEDVYGKTLGKLDDNTAYRVWRTRDKARDIEVYTGYDVKTLDPVDLQELPISAKTELGVSI